jgi:PAS domain-containing protein
MSQKEIEIILTRQLASYLALPIFIVDLDGNLIFYNERAELILGQHFEETGEMPAETWATVFQPIDQKGESLSPEALPLMIALTERRPAHRRFWIRGLDNVLRHIEVSAFPIIGQADRHLGALALFWEVGA